MTDDDTLFASEHREGLAQHFMPRVEDRGFRLRQGGVEDLVPARGKLSSEPELPMFGLAVVGVCGLSWRRTMAAKRSPSVDQTRAALILASRSPQRRAILDQLRIAYEAVPVDIDEISAGPPAEIARANALAKARAGALERPGRTVLGVDTVVVLDGEIFGKPASADGAAAIIERLQGRTHEVVSGLALLDPRNTQVVHEATEVTFRRVDSATITRYVATGEWRGRAGGYAIQGQGAALVQRIMGDYLNVVGLPVAAMLDLDFSLILRQG